MIEGAAEATSRYFVMPGQEGDPAGWYVIDDQDSSFEMRFTGDNEAQAACDRLNLVAVLKAIREPSESMRVAGDTAFENGYVNEVYTAMIDALIAEVAIYDRAPEHQPRPLHAAGPVMPETPSAAVRDAIVSTGAVGHGWSVDGLWTRICAALAKEQE